MDAPIRLRSTFYPNLVTRLYPYAAVGTRALGIQQEGLLCHPGSGGQQRSRLGGRVPVLQTSGDQPLRALGTRWRRTPAGPGPAVTSTARCKQSWLGRFLSTYGWRAYALPVLVVVTGVVLYQTMTGTAGPGDRGGGPAGRPIGSQPARHHHRRRPAARSHRVRRQPAHRAAARRRARSPGGGQAAHRPRTTPKVGEGTAKTFTYTVEIGDGIDTSSFGGGRASPGWSPQTLDNPKSWTHNPQFAFQRTDGPAARSRTRCR